MSDPQPLSPGELRSDSPNGGKVFLSLSGIFVALLLIAVLNPAPVKAAWEALERIIQLKSKPLPASPPELSEHETENLPQMSPQEQATLLLERAINHYSGAIELIDQDVPAWYGQLEVENGRLAGLLNTAINANDLRVRAASLEIYLAVYNLPKAPDSVDEILARLENEPDHRAWLLWILGVLGNRGVETQRVENAFLDRIHDTDETTRVYAVTGLGLIATDSSIAPLITAFREDPSAQVRERAACSLAQSGMFTEAQRMRAVPDLLQMMDDASLDATTRTWVFQALRDITGASIGSDPAAWRNWWSEHARG
jgi:HEAT repeats